MFGTQLAGASEGTHGDAKCATEILGGEIWKLGEGQNLKCVDVSV